MNHALLTELQHLSSFPSITMLATTHPGSSMSRADTIRIDDLVAEADDRLHALVDDDTRVRLVDTLRQLLSSAARGRTSQAVGLFVSPEHNAVVRLGRSVDDRVVIDSTFATRDLVADSGRTAIYRVVCVSDERVRVLVGDRSRLVEVDDSSWPLRRDPEEGPQAWRQRVGAALRRECAAFEIPTVVAGVTSTVRHLAVDDIVAPIGSIPGNHDRTDVASLRRRADEHVAEWLGEEQHRALARLEHARGARVYAGGVDEVWDLANDGRVELLVVEDDYRRAARLDGGHLSFTDDLDGPDVIEDAVDELIKTVLRSGGQTVMVAPGELRQHDHLAAVLRY